jgi:DNA (cytosine-5)-methyltransferase 1
MAETIPDTAGTGASISLSVGLRRPRHNPPRLLDLFCGAGGAAVGYQRAGFEIVGVDIHDQPNFPLEFQQDDALKLDPADIEREFDAIHASPPCQAYSDLRTAWNAKKHAHLILAVRELLQATGLPYVIENVEGAPLRNPMRLCGTMFGLGTEGYDLHRHRLFESPNLFALLPPCVHDDPVIGVYGDHVRSRGHWRKGADFPGRDKLVLASKAMGIDWMTWKEISQAIPPAYTEWIGAVMVRYLAGPRATAGVA